MQKYCDMLSAAQLPLAVTAWENCTAMIVLRETLLAMHRSELSIVDPHAEVRICMSVLVTLTSARTKDIMDSLLPPIQNIPSTDTI